MPFLFHFCSLEIGWQVSFLLRCNFNLFSSLFENFDEESCSFGSFIRFTLLLMSKSKSGSFQFYFISFHDIFLFKLLRRIWSIIRNEALQYAQIIDRKNIFDLIWVSLCLILLYLYKSVEGLEFRFNILLIKWNFLNFYFHYIFFTCAISSNTFRLLNEFFKLFHIFSLSMTEMLKLSNRKFYLELNNFFSLPCSCHISRWYFLNFFKFSYPLIEVFCFFPCNFFITFFQFLFFWFSTFTVLLWNFDFTR